MTQNKMPKVPEVGAYVLETLTTGMYRDPRDALREYVQNSLDSIIAAELNDFLAPNCGKVTIAISDERQSVSIKDNGLGVPVEQANSTLLGVGRSNKNPEYNAGFRGIGRLAGIAYCNELVFRTTTPKSRTGVEVVLDCVKLRAFMTDRDNPVLALNDALREAASSNQFDSIRDEHFFEVRLNFLVNDGTQFLDANYLQEYLESTAPCEYDNQKFVFCSKIREKISESSFPIPSVQLELRNFHGGIDIRKPYRTKYEIFGGEKVDIKDVNFFGDLQGNYWGWYSESDLVGQITDKKSRGIRFRCSNISIGGSENFEEIFSLVSDSAKRFNSYFVGEIFIRPGFITPNARRDGFEDTKRWRDLREELRELAAKLEKEIRDSSKSRNKSVDKIKRESSKALEVSTEALDAGFASQDGKEKAIEKLDKAISKIEGAEKGKDRTKEEQAQLKAIKGQLLEQQERIAKAKFVVTAFSGKVDRKQRKLLKTVFEVLEKHLDKDTFSRVRMEILKALG